MRMSEETFNFSERSWGNVQKDPMEKLINEEN